MQLPLQVRLLGGFALAIGDEPVVTLNTPRLQSFLAYLLLNRDLPQPRQYVAFLLWPDSTEAQAQTNLRNLIHRLRAALPQIEQHLLIDSHTLQWNNLAPFTLDMQEFERLVAGGGQGARARDEQLYIESLGAAAKLYTGDLLPGLYDDWIIPRREKLREQHIYALETLAAALGATGRFSEALIHAEQLKRYDPLRENTYRTLMELSAARGDFTAALRYYQECAAILEQELGVQPGLITQQTYRLLLHKATAQQQDNGTAAEPTLAKNNAPTNLPSLPNTFVGRQAELAAIDAMLAQDGVRLLTLVGPPGVGKTRLGLHAASGSAHRFSDGVYFIALGPIDSATLVPSTLASVLGVRERSDQPVISGLTEWLGNKRVLLVLDNFEHVLEAAPAIASLLSACSQLKIVATSRQALQLYGEHEFPVLPLELPAISDAATMTSAQLGEYSALRLFKERAAAVQPGFSLNDDNAAVVAAICRKLDALPLAIELAATRVKQLPPKLLLARLEQRLGELASGARDLPLRHRTLRSAIEWSYNLLNKEEQYLFRSLSVFAGGCTVEGAVALYGADQRLYDRRADISALLFSLADKSLLQVYAHQDRESRFGMLETLGEFARNKLVESGDEQRLREHHAAFYADWLERNSELLNYSTRETLEQLGAEDGDLRAALAWSVDYGNVEVTSRLWIRLVRYWFTRGRIAEGMRLFDLVTSNQSRLPPALRARLLPMASALAVTSGDVAKGMALLEEGVAISRELGDSEILADALRLLAFATILNAQFNEAAAAAGEGLALSSRLNNKLGIGACLLILSLSELYQGQFDQGMQSMARSADIFEQAEDLQAISFNLVLSGHALLLWGEYRRAEASLKKSLLISRQIDDQRNLADCVVGLGEIGAARSDHMRAAQLFGVAAALRIRVGAVMWPLHMPMYERSLTDVRTQLGEAEFHAAWEWGQALSSDQAIELALA